MAKLLGYLQIFIAVGAIAGGIGLVSDPSGGNLEIPLEVLSASPFQDFLIPGLVLLFFNGLGHLIAGIFTLISKRSAAPLAIGMGGFLATWIVLQVWWIGLVSWLQPLYLGLGILEITLGVWQRRQQVEDHLLLHSGQPERPRTEG